MVEKEVTSSPEFDAQTYVNQMVELLELPLPADIRSNVVKDFERLIAIAQPVLDFELPDTVEPAPTFRP